MKNHPHFAPIFLQRLPETGAGICWRLLDAFHSAEAVLQAPISHLQSLVKPSALNAIQAYQDSSGQDAISQMVCADLERLDKDNALQCVLFEDPAYPELLRQIANPPHLLYLRGEISTLHLPQIAIVGSRNPSSGGSENAESFARYLAQQGFAITSGLALGVDGSAHKGALAGWGKTIAVMGTAADRIYPSRHRALAQEIIEKGGALVSEFPLGTGSYAGNFPQRNRIISGLSLGTLVVEAALQSGSLITARQALEQNREVFAIPGSIHNPLSKGCHQLIRQGATLVESAQDILNQLQGLLEFKWQEVQQELPFIQNEKTQAPSPIINQLDADQTQLLNLLGFDPVSLDQLAERTQLPVHELIPQLTLLELSGKIETIGGCYQRI